MLNVYVNDSRKHVTRKRRYSDIVHVCIPDGVSDDAVQGPHLLAIGEAGQVGSQSLTEPLSFLP